MFQFAPGEEQFVEKCSMKNLFFILNFVEDRNPGNFWEIREKIILNTLARHSYELRVFHFHGNRELGA